MQAELGVQAPGSTGSATPGPGGMGARQGRGEALGSPTTLSVPRDGFLSRGTRMSSPGRPVAQLKPVRSAEGKAARTTQQRQAEACPHHGAPRPGAGTLHPELWLGRGRVWPPGCALGWELAPPRRGPQRPAPSPVCLGMSPQPFFFGAARALNQISSGKITSGEEVPARLTGHG